MKWKSLSQTHGKFPWECDVERILKIGLHILQKLRWKTKGVVFLSKRDVIRLSPRVLVVVSTSAGYDDHNDNQNDGDDETGNWHADRSLTESTGIRRLCHGRTARHRYTYTQEVSCNCYYCVLFYTVSQKTRTFLFLP